MCGDSLCVEYSLQIMCRVQMCGVQLTDNMWSTAVEYSLQIM